MAKGAEPFIDWENDKPTVVALREIEENYVIASILDEVPEEDIWEEETLAIPESAEVEELSTLVELLET